MEPMVFEQSAELNRYLRPATPRPNPPLTHKQAVIDGIHLLMPPILFFSAFAFEAHFLRGHAPPAPPDSDLPKPVAIAMCILSGIAIALFIVAGILGSRRKPQPRRERPQTMTITESAIKFGKGLITINIRWRSIDSLVVEPVDCPDGLNRMTVFRRDLLSRRPSRNPVRFIFTPAQYTAFQAQLSAVGDHASTLLCNEDAARKRYVRPGLRNWIVWASMLLWANGFILLVSLLEAGTLHPKYDPSHPLNPAFEKWLRYYGQHHDLKLSFFFAGAVQFGIGFLGLWWAGRDLEKARRMAAQLEARA
jgi:hypothetical protein